jgi:hypothetical protein
MPRHVPARGTSGDTSSYRGLHGLNGPKERKRKKATAAFHPAVARIFSSEVFTPTGLPLPCPSPLPIEAPCE